jgi:uncharacterized protein with PIN domain
VFLTRDVNLAMRRDAASAAPYVLLSDRTEEQLREVAQRWGLTFKADKAMSRLFVEACRHTHTTGRDRTNLLGFS